MKQSRVADFLARVVAGHPRTILAALVVITAALAAQLPRLEADPSPRALLASADAEQERIEAEARRHFGSTDNVMVVVLDADDVLRRDVLDYAHGLARSFEKLPHVERVDVLTRVTWPKVQADTGSLDDLDSIADEPEPDPTTLGAAADLVAARADVFPNGLASLSERAAGKKLEPLVSGEHVRDSDLEDILAAAQSPQLVGRLISRDHRHLLVTLSCSDALVKHADVEAVVHRVEDWLSTHRPPQGVRAELSGLPVVRTSLVRHMRADQRVLIPGTLLASFIVLAFSFRWAPAVLLPILAVGLTALWLLGGMALFHEPLNVLNGMLPALVIIIGLNEAVHIIGRYVEEHERFGDKVKALRETVQAMGAACLMTTLTSAVGLAALVVSRTLMLRRFGLVGACGLLLAYAVTLLVVPACLALLRAPPAPDAEQEKRGLLEILLARASMSALRHPFAVLGVSVALSLAAGFCSQRVVVDSTLLDQFSARDPVYQSARVLETSFEGVRPLEVALVSERPGRFLDPELMRAMHTVAEWAAKQRGVLRVSDPSEPVSLGWAAVSGRGIDLADALKSRAQVSALVAMLRSRDARILSPMLTADGSHARIRIKLADVGSHATRELVEALRTQLTESLAPFSDVRFAFGGDAYVSSRGLDAVVADLSGSVLAAALVIFVLLAVLLRDLRLAVLAIPANLLPQVWTMAWMVLRGIPLNASSAIIFSLSIGLAVDGSIHVVSRFQEERAKGSLVVTSIVRAVRGTGRNILVSSAALVLGFSVMLLSNFVPVQRFAELITVSMAGSAIATLVLQPVILHLWASRSPRAQHHVAPVLSE